MQIVPQYLPQEFGARFLFFTLILTLTPYVFGHDFGIFKIPDFGATIRSKLNWAGPCLLVVAVLIHIPFGPATCDEPVYEMVIDREFCGTSKEEYVVPARPKSCRHVDFGQVGWSRTATITRSSGWRMGSSNPTKWCNELIAGFIGSRSIGPNYHSETLGTREVSNKGWSDYATYEHHCTVKIDWDPVYEERTDPKCGMWPAETALREVAAQCKKQVGSNNTNLPRC